MRKSLLNPPRMRFFIAPEEGGSLAQRAGTLGKGLRQGKRVPPPAGRRGSLQAAASRPFAEPTRRPETLQQMAPPPPRPVPAPPAGSQETPPPGRARSPAQAPPPHRRNVPAGARACPLIPRLPAPAATLAAGRRRRAASVSLPRETPFAPRAVWPPRRRAESDAPGPRPGVPRAQRPPARCLAAAVTAWSLASTEESGLPPRARRRPAFRSPPCGERPSLTRLLPALLLSGGRRFRSRCAPTRQRILKAVLAVLSRPVNRRRSFSRPSCRIDVGSATDRDIERKMFLVFPCRFPRLRVPRQPPAGTWPIEDHLSPGLL